MSNSFKRVLAKANTALNRVTEVVAENADVAGNRVLDRLNQVKYDMDMKKLRPIFPSTLNSSSFSLPKMIRITEADRRHLDSPACQGAIGHFAEHKQLSVAYLYPETVELFNLEFFPDKDSEVYYVDPSNSCRYIALDDYFIQLKTARVNELQKM